MSEVEIYSLISGIFMPFVINLVSKNMPGPSSKFLTALIMSVICGVVVCLINGKITSTQDLTISAGIVFAASQTAYKVFFKKQFNL